MQTNFLTDLTRDVVEASRVRSGQSVGGAAPNTTGATLLQPSGRCAYPAFWLRDHALSVASGFITFEEQRHALLLAAQTQQAEDWRTPAGSFVPKGAIADHVTFGGEAVFFPGTLDAKVQSSAWGTLPSLDDHFLFVDMAWEYCQQTGERGILSEVIAGSTLLERLELAFAVPRSRLGTELVWCDEIDRGTSFGFLDAVVHTGELLFASVLRQQAARQLAELTGNPKYSAIAKAIGRSLPEVLAHSGGLLRASTGLSGQPDVFGSAYAVYSGAVEGKARAAICSRLADAYQAGTLALRGSVRNVLTTDDFSAQSAWERTVGPIPLNEYQNGAYWSPPTGWVCFAIAQENEPLAKKLADEYLAELREGDFRKGADCGSPWECVHPQGNYRQTAVCVTGVTVPLAAFRRLGWCR